MARIMNDLKFPQEIGGHVEVTNRRLTPQLAPYLVPFQPQARIYPPRRRLEIAIEVKPGAELPYPVKITHTV
jgi:hypothetical protein